MDLKTLLLSIINFIIAFDGVSSSCESYNNCKECILDPSGCMWCSKDDYAFKRCVPVTDVAMEENCASDIQNPQNRTEIFNVESKPGTIAQITPRDIKIHIRPGQWVDFSFKFKAADDYPVDMYFLVDNSNTMVKIKREIAETSNQIYKDMNNLTKNIRLGIGTFVDKNAVPFVTSAKKDAGLTYSYKNELKLTADVNEFRTIMSKPATGSNTDLSESGFDGLAQAMACHDEIGWRSDSRKIILLITDDLSHSAGDGRLAGITYPYDGKCYTTKGIYTKELEMDYPSISAINKLAVENHATIIFIVREDHKTAYERLNIQGSMVVHFTKNEDKLEDFNFTDSLTKIYKLLTRSIKLKVEMANDIKNNVEITFNPNCNGSNDTDECIVKKDTPIVISGKVKLKKFAMLNDKPIKIYVEGINEVLSLSLNVIDRCPCESKIIENDHYCSSGGTKVCGICQCNSGRYGDTCGCDHNDRSLETKLKYTNCTDPKSSDRKVCNGQGDCKCGVCSCFPDYEGKYCECNKESCPDHCNYQGTCECGGVCKCNNGWTGPTCACPTTEDACYNDGKKCNDHGNCKCGKCECKPIASWDARPTQDKQCVILPCPECKDKQCSLLEKCALCHYKKEHPCSSCSFGLNNDTLDGPINVTVYKTLPNHENAFICDNVRVKTGCYTQFAYVYKEDEYGIDLLVQDETDSDCSPTFYIFGGIFLATLILIGLGTVIAWKFLTDARDRREYERFIASSGYNTAKCINPIYEPATTTFTNPRFRKPSVDNL